MVGKNDRQKNEQKKGKNEHFSVILFQIAILFNGCLSTTGAYLSLVLIRSVLQDGS